MIILSLPLIQGDQLSVNGEICTCTLRIDKQRLGGLSMNSVVRITDHPDMTSAAYHGRKTTNQTNMKTRFYRGIIFSYLYLKHRFGILVTGIRNPNVGERERVIRITCPCSEHPLTPHFYIEKVGFTRVYIFSLLLLQNIDCEYSLEPPR